MPFQADIQSAVFYLPNLLLTLFVRDGRLPYYALEVMLLAHYWLAAVTMYYLAKELALESVHALFSALVFALSGFMIVRAIHPGFVEQLAWLPLIVLLFHRAMLRHSVSYAVGAGVVLGHAILAGAPQISLFIGFFIGLLWLFLVVTDIRERGFRAASPKLWVVALMGLATVGVAAIQLLPTIELIPLSQRATMSFEGAQHGRLSWVQLVSAVIPKFQGAEGARESTFWLTGEYGAYWETCFYLGIPALLTIAMSATLIRTDRWVAFLFGVLTLSILLAVGDQFFLHRLFFRFVPGFSNFRAIGRMVMLVTFCGSLLAGHGLRAFVRAAGRSSRRLEIGVLGALAVVAILCGLVWRDAFIPSVEPAAFARMHDYSTTQAAWALSLALAVAVAAMLWTRSIVGSAYVIALFFVIQFVDVMQFGTSHNEGGMSADRYYRLARTRVQPLLADPDQEPFRIVTRSDKALMVDRNEGMVDRLSMIEGYTPLALQRRLPPAKSIDQTYDLLNAKYRIVVDSQTREMAFRASGTYLPRAFVVHTVQVIPDSTAIEQFMRSDAFDPRRAVVIEESLPIRLDPDTASHYGPARIERYRLNTIDIGVTTSRPAVLVLSEIYYPGWVAYVDGAPSKVYRANWNLRAVPLPAGARHIEMRFEAPPFRRGALITILTLGAAAAVIGVSIARRTRLA